PAPDAVVRDVGSARDLSLRIPVDADDELVEALLLELPQHAASLSECIQRIADSGPTPALLRHAQRIAHTVKGAANTVGVEGIASLTHVLEEGLQRFTREGRLPGPGARQTLLDAVDCLESMIEALQLGASGSFDASAVFRALQGMDAADVQSSQPEANDRGEQPPPGTGVLPGPPGSPRPGLSAGVSPPPLGGPESTDPYGPLQGTSPTAAGERLVRIPARILDELLRMLGETLILGGQLRESLQSTARQANSLQDSYRLMRAHADEFERLLDLEAAKRTVHAPGDEQFDPLELERYSELYSCGRRLLEAAVDTQALDVDVDRDIARLEDRLHEQGRVQRQAQRTLLAVRMVDARSISARLRRAVRQACRVAGKQVELKVTGEATRLDSDVLDALIDPLMHLIRNAVDHGIETASQRSLAGKPASGSISVAFRTEGSDAVVSCTDDGAGFDLVGLRSAATRLGLAESGQDLDSDGIMRLALLPSVTTRDNVTELSGRGTGLDVVQTSVRAIGGSVSLSSEPGLGACVELRVPLTRLVAHGLDTKISGQRFVVADRGVQQVVPPVQADYEHAESGRVLVLADARVPCSDLETLLGLPTAAFDPTRRYHLVVEEGGQLHALGMDEVMGAQEVIFKSMGRFVPRLPGIAGVTIMGNGEVTPILDLPGLLQARRESMAVSSSASQPGSQIAASAPRSKALVADDSLSARRALCQLLADAGFEVLQARDGMEAVQLIEQHSPTLLLLDLEMPRMNGIEVVRHVRADPRSCRIPIVIVTSRATDKHRRVAEQCGADAFFTKPFMEDELLDVVVDLVRAEVG
ncbi:MAG: response regulator, partial [Gammaproteobacteria bacterium]|nr:response regulator [Gammaproteobacteria bacterium]